MNSSTIHEITWDPSTELWPRHHAVVSSRASGWRLQVTASGRDFVLEAREDVDEKVATFSLLAEDLALMKCVNFHIVQVGSLEIGVVAETIWKGTENATELQFRATALLGFFFTVFSLGIVNCFSRNGP